MKKFRQLSEQLDVSSAHGPEAGRFATGAAKKPIPTTVVATPKSRQEVPMEAVAPEAGEDINNQPSPELNKKGGKTKSADPMAGCDTGSMSRYMPEEKIDEIVTPDLKQDISSMDSSSFKKKHGKSKIEAHKYVSEARMSAAMKLQKAYQREQEKTASERKAGEELLKKPVKEEIEQLEEGRPSQRHPLEGHDYHKKTNAELEYIAKDAHKAAEAMKSHNTSAENKYRDQASDSATVRYYRQKNGMQPWYKKKYGHVNESRKAEIVKQASKDAKKKSKEKEVADDKFQPEPTLDSQVIKTD